MALQSERGHAPGPGPTAYRLAAKVVGEQAQEPVSPRVEASPPPTVHAPIPPPARRSAGALVLTACGDDVDAGHDSMGSSDTSASAESSAEADFSDTDVTFAAGMMPHHQSAIEMAQLAESRAADPRVLDLAARIKAAQGPEIEILSGWLEQSGADGESGADHGGMDHGSGGMMSEQDLQALMNATGAEFDRMFLTQMIAHHTGAVEMAQAELSEGRNPAALSMAGSIRDSQSAEMEQLLAEIGG